MGEKIVVGPNKGLKTDVTAFNIDNDSFPTLINAYQWRGRIKRKRGTSLLGRLTRFFNSLDPSYGSTTTITLSGLGAGNLLTGFSLQANGNIVPGSVTITGLATYTDANEDGTLINAALAVIGSINYSTGAIVIVSEANNAISASFLYYPDLPVMGLEDFYRSSTQYPLTIAFDTKYSYNIVTADPYPIYDVSFYKNPAVDATNLPGYIPKTDSTPTSWNGQDYQQFWTTNYQGALWATNGIDVPFTGTNIGMQFKAITGIAIITAGNGTTIPAVADLTIVAHGLVQGDFLFINEVANTIVPPTGITGINYQTGYVTSANPQAANLVRVTFPFAILGGAYTSGGIAQYLTNRSDVTKDCLRFYDGDPTDGNSTSPSLTGVNGWVNFAPPLSIQDFSITDLPPDQYYLVGARMLLPFKDRLLCFGPVVQSSSGSPKYLQDTVIYSQNGTPYYTVSYFNTPSAAVDNPTSPTNVLHPILLPDNQTGTPSAWFEDQTGFGGFVSAGLDQPLITAAANGDVIITGFNFIQARLVYSGNDIQPFNFYLIDNEWGSGSTFSVINMGRGVLSRGSRGYINTSQERADRIDLEIPDQVFEIRLNDNGAERFTAQRDFINEWIYFTYTSNQETHKFPNQSLQFNYRDNSWAIFNEAYTHYGLFRKQTGFTWQTVGLKYPSWEEWNDPWNAGTSTLLQPEVIAGNQQGFVLVRDEGTGEGNSLAIQSISGSVVTSPEHTLNEGDFIVISGAIGTIGAEINGKIFKVQSVTTNTFTLSPNIGSGTYFGGGLIKRMYVPFIQTKQFAPSWGMSRKVRLGVQQYLITTTNRSQIQLQIYLSQNSDSPYNKGYIVPAVGSVNNSLLYSTTLFTCPESTNLGLTPANVNLNMPTAIRQAQTWHRINTSLIGDSVQLGFSMTEQQMRQLDDSGTPAVITAISAPGYPTVLDAVNTFRVNQLITISNVVGMTQLNGNTYIITAVTPTQITINADSTTFDAYVSGGLAEREVFISQFAEIEIHGFIIDVTPSQVLA